MMPRVDVSSFDSIMTCIFVELFEANRLSIMVAWMCMYTIILMSRMWSADFPRTREVVIIISNRLLLPMMPGVSFMMTTSSIHLQILSIAVTSMMRTDGLVTTVRLYLTKISTLINMLRTWLISIGLIPLSLVGLLVVLFCVFVSWGGLNSILLDLIPRIALGLLHEFLLPVGRSRFLPLVVASVCVGMLSFSMVSCRGASSLVLGWKMHRHAFAASSYCS